MSDLVTLADRRAVYALLERMLDWLPPAPLALRRPEPSAGVKPGEGRWQKCSRCAGEGRVLGDDVKAQPCRRTHDHWPYGHGCRPCLACQNGWVTVTLAGVDTMLNPGKTDFETDGAVRAERRRWVDAQLVKLRALDLQHRDQEAADDAHTRAHVAKARLYASGSFSEVEIAMDALALQHPLRHAAVVFFVVERQLPATDATRVRLDETVDWLALRVRALLRSKPILLPADAAAELATWKHTLEHGRTPAHRQQRDQRNREIVTLVTQHGWSLRRVGRHYDLSHVTVLKIVREAGEHAAVASGPAA